MASSRPGSSRPAAAPLAVVTVLLLWASAFIAIRGIGDTFSPGPLALGRLAVGTLALSVLVLQRRWRGGGGGHGAGNGGVGVGSGVGGAGGQPRRARQPLLPRGRGLALVAAYGVLWFAAYTVLLNAAERHLDAGTAAMLVNIGPLVVAAAAGVLLGEGFPRPLVVGLVVGFAGVAVIAVGGVGGHSDGLGVALGVVTALLYAAGVLTQKVALRTVDAVTATWLGCAIGTVVLLPFLPGLVREVAASSLGADLTVVYLGVFPTALAFTLWAWALRTSDAGRLTTTTLAVPAITVVLSWLVLREVPTLLGVVGGVLALAGVALSRRRSRAAVPAPDVLAPCPAGPRPGSA